jgi:hypothetical protein
MKSVSRQPGDRATFAMCKQERRKGTATRDNAHVEKLPEHFFSWCVTKYLLPRQNTAI